MRHIERRHGVAMIIVVLAGLSACGQTPPPAASTCTPPQPRVSTSTTPEDTASDVAFNCVRMAAYEGVRSGAPVDAAAQGAVTGCADKEALYLKAIAGGRMLYDYERGVIHDQLTAAARLTATQKRSRGCGRPGGRPEAPEMTGEQ